MSDDVVHMQHQRRILVVTHTGRAEAVAVAQQMIRTLQSEGIAVHLLAEDAAGLGLSNRASRLLNIVAHPGQACVGCELAVVIGGDGTILRAAELTRDAGTPLLGVNLGHVGFLAEAETEDIEATTAAIVERKYTTEERLTIEVTVSEDGQVVTTSWALNEASIEKAARERMLEVVVGIDGRPLSRWACDGVVCATPTGSTAYNFSAGGPVVWPGVKAMLLVPLSAHALFARPLVVAPDSVIGIDVLDANEGAGVLWCDGRRRIELPPGARIEVRKGAQPVRLARLHQAPFTDRLVAKFGLSVDGWRGSAARRFTPTMSQPEVSLKDVEAHHD